MSICDYIKKILQAKPSRETYLNLKIETVGKDNKTLTNNLRNGLPRNKDWIPALSLELISKDERYYQGKANPIMFHFLNYFILLLKIYV